MKCICCQSSDIKSTPIRLKGYQYCSDCGFLFKSENDPLAARQQIARHYEVTDPHKAVADSKGQFFAFALKKLPNPGHNHLSLLDVGCGYGYFLKLSARKGWRASGVEIAEDAVIKARQLPGIDSVFHGTLREASFLSSTFDVITLWDVLVVVEDPVEELKECLRILKVGGKIGIRVRNVTFQKMLYWVYRHFSKIFVRLGIKRPYVFHPYCFSKKSIYLLLNRLGYTNIQITMSPLTYGDPYNHAQLKGLVKNAKFFVGIVSGFIYKISNGFWMLSPSLMVWAEKPCSKND